MLFSKSKKSSSEREETRDLETLTEEIGEAASDAVLYNDDLDLTGIF